jgi:cell wall-associated NlpC family hydrolase
VTRRLATLIALLATLLLTPTVASAAAPNGHPGPWGGGASAATVADIDTDDPTGGAGADDAADLPAADDAAQDAEDAAEEAAQDAEDAAEDVAQDEAGDEGVQDDGELPEVAAGLGTTTGPDPAVLVPVPSSRRTVKGRVARLRTDGRVAIPRSAPKSVKRVLAAANLIVGKPYKWGGGHARLADSGYDCSGAVSYALIRAGLLRGSMVSGGFARWAVKGAGRWISIHANDGHVYMEVAGMRLDTSRVGDPGGRQGVRWRPVIGRRVGFHTRHIKGL